MDIIPYEPCYRDDFVSLNRAWIEGLFVLEGPDLDLFENVDSRTESGAVILLGLEFGSVIATCMATPLGGDVWELEKLTVAEGHRGRGLGTMMLRATIDAMRDRGCRRVLILTNSKLSDAVHIYMREGFREVPVDPSFGYGRVDLQLEKTLTDRSWDHPS